MLVPMRIALIVNGKATQVTDARVAGVEAALVSAFLLSLEMNDADSLAALLAPLSGKAASAAPGGR